MNRRSWVLLGALALFAGLLLYTLGGGDPRQETGALTPESFWREDRNAVQRVEVEREDRPTLVIERAVPETEVVGYRLPGRFQGAASAPFDAFMPPGPETEWWITEPARLPADASQVASLLFTLTEPRPLERISGEEQASAVDLQAFGLHPPKATVRLQVEQDGGQLVTRELQVGDPTPLRSSTGDAQSYYVAVPGQAGVYTLSSYPLETILEEAEALRLKQFARFGPNEAVAVRLLWDGKPLVRLVRTGEYWRVEAPEPLPADASAVQDLLYDVDLLRAEEVVYEEASDEELAATGLANPRGEVLVWLSPEEPVEGEPDESTDEDLTRAQVLWVGDFLSDGSGIYVRLATDRTVYRVRAERLQSFFDATARPIRLAQRSLLPPRWETGAQGSIRRVTWEGPEGTAVAERGDDGAWSGPVDAQAFLRSITDFRAAEAVASGAAAAEAAGWAPGEPLPEGAEQLTLEPEPGSQPSTPVVVTRLPGEERMGNQERVRLFWQSGDDRLLLEAELEAWRQVAAHW